MRKLIILLLPLIIFGCVTIEIPEQIKEEFTYERAVDADFESSITASSNALTELGWKVSFVSRSQLIQKDETRGRKPIQIARIFTEVRQAQLFLTSSYSTFNIRLDAIDDSHTNIGVRYLSVVPIPPFFNKKINYKNDRLVDKLYANIEKQLSK